MSPVLLGTTDSGMQASGLQGLFGSAATETGAAVSADFVDLLSLLLLPPSEEEVPEDVPPAFVYPEAVPERETDPAEISRLVNTETLLPVAPVPMLKSPAAVAPPALTAIPKEPAAENVMPVRTPQEEAEFIPEPALELRPPVVLRHSKPASKAAPRPKDRKPIAEVSPSQLAAAVIRSMMVPTPQASPAPEQRVADEMATKNTRDPEPTPASGARILPPVPVVIDTFVPLAVPAPAALPVRTGAAVEMPQTASPGGESLPQLKATDTPLAFGLQFSPRTAEIGPDSETPRTQPPQTGTADAEPDPEGIKLVRPARPTPVAVTAARAERAAPQLPGRPLKESAEFARRIMIPAAPAPLSEARPQEPAASPPPDLAPAPRAAAPPTASAVLAEPVVLPYAKESGEASDKQIPLPPSASERRDSNPPQADRPPKESSPVQPKQRSAGTPVRPENQFVERTSQHVSAPVPAAPVHRAEGRPILAEPAFQAPTVAPHESVGHALRESLPMQIAEAAPHANLPVREIAVRVATPDQSPVDLQMTERGGRVRVDVRTHDGALQSALRQDLGSLVQSLERSGYRAEAFVPADTHKSPASPQHLYTHQAESGAGSFDQRGERRHNPREPQPRPRRKQEVTVDAMETAA